MNYPKTILIFITYLQGMMASIASLVHDNVLLHILSTPRHLRQYIIHSGVDFVAVDGALGLGIAYSQTRVPIILPEIYMFLSQASLLLHDCFLQQL